MMLRVDSRLPWFAVLISAFGLETAALYFQYGLNLDPCVLCVYQRTAMFGIVLGGLIGFVAPRIGWLRLLGYLTFGGSAAAGLKLALEHVDVQAGIGLGCDFMANYPDWFKLDVWFPALFQPTGYCDEIKWQLLGWSMPEWMVVVFGIYLVVLVYALVLEVKGFRDRR